MPEKNITAVVFDIGNVLLRPNREAFKQFAPYCKHTPDEIWNMIYAGEGAPVQLHEIGKLTSLEFFRAVCKRGNFLGLSRSQFYKIWNSMVMENDGVSEVLDKMKPGVKLGLLSNTNELHWEVIPKLPVMQRFSSAATVLSFRVGVRKPDIKLFDELLRRCGLKSSEAAHVLYIDDVEEYCQAFRDFGGEAFRYDWTKEPPSKLEEGLREYGVLQ